MSLSNKRCAITGAGNGIGRAAARLFAASKAEVFLLDVNLPAAQAVADEIRAAGGAAAAIHCDVADDASVAAAFAAIASGGALHALYNNASVYWNGRDGRITEIEPADWQQIISINLNGVYHCCRHAIPLLRRAGGGAIINTASSAGVLGIPNCDAYTASKGATVALTRSLASEYGRDGIRVNCIAPAAIATDMIAESNPDGDDFDAEAFLLVRTPLRRWGRPEEVAALARFLASDESSYINGAVIAADGGITINGDLGKAVPGR